MLEVPIKMEMLRACMSLLHIIRDSEVLLVRHALSLNRPETKRCTKKVEDKGKRMEIGGIEDGV